MNLVRKIFQFMFPCKFNELSCKDNLLGCKCGKWGKDKEEAESGIQQAGNEVYQSGQMSPLEQAQYGSSFGLGDILAAIQMYQTGMEDRPQGYLNSEGQYLQNSGPVGQMLYGQTAQETADPYAYYESTLQPQLQASEDYINRQAAGRGLLQSGIPIEQMGRAGVELSIKEADARQQARSNALQRAAGLTEYMQGQESNRLASLGSLYGQQQGYGLTASGRQAGQGQAAGQYQAYPYQAQLGQSYGQQSGAYSAAGSLIGSLLSNWGNKGNSSYGSSNYGSSSYNSGY